MFGPFGCGARPSGRARIETRFPCLVKVVRRWVAPGLRVGRGLKPSSLKPSNKNLCVAPGLRVGRGLKQLIASSITGKDSVAPGLRVGRGLKPAPGGGDSTSPDGGARPSGRARIETRHASPMYPRPQTGGARPSGRARIETIAAEGDGADVGRGARPSGRARIETLRGRTIKAMRLVAPGLRVGRGLKRASARGPLLPHQVAPGLRVGRGLKQATIG